MTTERPRNMTASVKARLLQLAKERREEFQSVLTRYAAQRFLYRLSRSSHRQRFIVKWQSIMEVPLTKHGIITQAPGVNLVSTSTTF